MKQTKAVEEGIETFEPTQIQIQKGDIITSKLGMISRSAITKECFRVFKSKYLGNNNWCAIKKEKIEGKWVK